MLREVIARALYDDRMQFSEDGHWTPPPVDAAWTQADAVLDALGLERWYVPDRLYEELWDDQQREIQGWPALYRLASPSLTPSPEADVRSEQSEANRTDAKEEG
jgi:hypothetical protein